MAKYKVSLNVWQEIEADSKDEAEAIFLEDTLENLSSGTDMIEIKELNANKPQ